MDNVNRRKEYVQVIALFTPEGNLIPKIIILGDGRKFAIDKVVDIRRATSRRPGMPPLQYTCQIWGQKCFLFYEDNSKWFTMLRAS